MWHFLGNTYYKNGNRTLAGPFFRKAIEVEPLFTSGYVGMVRVLKREEKYMEAIEVRQFLAYVCALCIYQWSKKILGGGGQFVYWPE